MASYISYIPALGWLILGLAVVLTAYALFADRAKGRRRCPKCWYDMAGLPGPQCPECGHAARNDRALSRTRRRWKRLVFTVPLAIIGYAGIVGPGVLSDGARAIVPNALVALWPLDPRLLVEPDLVPEPTGRVNRFMFKELTRRIDEHRFADWQFDVITGRIRREYTRLGRYGVSEQEQAILEKLASTPFEPEVLPANMDDLLNAFDHAGIRFFCTMTDEDRVATTFHRGFSAALALESDSPATLLDALRNLDQASMWAWTIDQDLVLIDVASTIESRLKVELLPASDLAPAQRYTPLTNSTNTSISSAIDTSQRDLLIESMTLISEDSPSFGFGSARMVIGNDIVSIATPLTLDRRKIALAAMRSARQSPAGTVTVFDGTRSRGRFNPVAHLRLYNLRQTPLTLGPRPDEADPNAAPWPIVLKARNFFAASIRREVLLAGGTRADWIMPQVAFIDDLLLVWTAEPRQALVQQRVLEQMELDLSTFQIIPFEAFAPHPPTK